MMVAAILRAPPIASRYLGCYSDSMGVAWSNIEAVARHLCEGQLLAAGVPASALSSQVDRYWHCVAAEIEAGLIDEQGIRLQPYEFGRGLEAYRDWRSRHPTYRVPNVSKSLSL